MRKKYKKTAAVLVVLFMLFLMMQPESAYASQRAACAVGTASARDGRGVLSDLVDDKGLSWKDIWNFLNGEDSGGVRPGKIRHRCARVL